MPKFYEEDSELDIFLNSDEFGTEVDFSGSVINCIFNDDYSQYNNGSVELSGTDPQIKIKKSDFIALSIEQDDECTIEDVIYIVKDIRKRSSGLYTIKLSIKDI